MKPGRLLFYAPRLPEYDRECGSLRHMRVVEFLLSAGWAVTYVAIDANPIERYITLLQQRGVATFTGLKHEEFEQLVLL